LAGQTQLEERILEALPDDARHLAGMIAIDDPVIERTSDCHARGDGYAPISRDGSFGYFSEEEHNRDPRGRDERGQAVRDTETADV